MHPQILNMALMIAEYLVYAESWFGGLISAVTPTRVCKTEKKCQLAARERRWYKFCRKCSWRGDMVSSACCFDPVHKGVNSANSSTKTLVTSIHVQDLKWHWVFLSKPKSIYPIRILPWHWHIVSYNSWSDNYHWNLIRSWNMSVHNIFFSGVCDHFVKGELDSGKNWCDRKWYLRT